MQLFAFGHHETGINMWRRSVQNTAPDVQVWSLSNEFCIMMWAQFAIVRFEYTLTMC